MVILGHSPHVQARARQALEQAAQADSRKARGLLRDAFVQVANDPGADHGERLLAGLGQAIAAGEMSDREAVAGREVLMGVLASTVGGALGPVVARAVLEAASKVGSRPARTFLKNGLESVRGCYPPHAWQAHLVAYGSKVAEGQMADASAVSLRSAILEQVLLQQDGRAPARVAEASLAAVRSGVPERTARGALKTALAQIQSMVGLTPVEKRLADYGLQVAAGEMADGDAVKLRTAVMEAMIGPGKEEPEAALIEATLKGLQAVSPRPARTALKTCFGQLVQAEDPRLRTLAQLGLDVAAGAMADEQAVSLRQAILAQMGREPAGSLALDLAQSLHPVLDQLAPTVARGALKTCFTSIQRVAAPGSRQHELGTRGIEVGAREMADAVAVERRRQVLETIIDEEVGRRREVERQVAALYAPESGPDLRLDSDQLEIAGHTVKVRGD